MHASQAPSPVAAPDPSHGASRDDRPGREHEWWLPVATEAELAPQRPLAVTLLGEPLVLWHDGAQAHAFTDRCPHRGARLSLGRVHDGQLECPYHGWRFGGDGQCRHVPALPDFVPPASHRVRRWRVRWHDAASRSAGPA